MIVKALIFTLSSLIVFSSCQSSPTPAKILLPNTPEEVAQQWVQAFYSDDFPKAMSLGTSITQMMIDSVKKEMEPNANMIAFKISDMTCEVKLDSAFCAYIYEEEGEKYEEYVSLLKVKKQWLVNEAWDPSAGVEQDFDLLKEEVERLLEEEALEKK